MISPKGIERCLEKIEAVLRLPSPRTIKEVQSLNGKLASMNRFLSNLAKKSLPLFNTLKKCIKKSDFHWTPEVEQEFKQLKQHLSELPMLVAPKAKEELIVYMSAFQRAISMVLMTKRGTVQMPAYFVSHALQGPELNYTTMEKLVLALVFTVKRAITKMKHHAGRTQYHLPTGDIYERTDPSGFPYREAKRSSTRYTTGPFPEGPKKVKFWIVAMEYFTKWIEEKAMTTITGSLEKKFVWDNIVCRFGLPREIVSDNVEYLQSNGLIERENRSLEAAIPAKIKMPMYRTTLVDVVHNDEELRLNLDLQEERCERAAICKAKAKLKMTKYYNARVRGVTFRPGDFVYSSNEASHAMG
nr:reverse transcriptase domain-containing protein [Tanacetum cinerariifolium]